MRRAKWFYAIPFAAKRKVTVSGRFPRIDGGCSRNVGRSGPYRWVRGRQGASTGPSQIRGVVTSWGPTHPGRVPEGYKSAVKGLRVVKILAELILAPVSGRTYISQEGGREVPIGGGSRKLLDLSPPMCQFLQSLPPRELSRGRVSKHRMGGVSGSEGHSYHGRAMRRRARGEGARDHPYGLLPLGL